MAVVINKESGLAEDLPEEQVNAALAAGSHEVPLNDPQGNPVTAKINEAPTLLGQGYTQPTPDQLQQSLNHAKYSSTTEQLKTGLEGAASAATFGGSTAIERGLGVAPEDIQGRRETNPGVHAVGQAAGLAATSLIPGLGEAGAAKILGGAGEAAARMAGLGAEGAGFVSKVGAAATKAAAENALFQAGDEASKMFSSDPNQSAETAMVDIGMSGLLGGATGGAFGTVSPLWKVTNESKLGKLLGAVRDKANGLERDLPPTSIDAAAEKAGITLDPAVKAALEETPEAKQMFQHLMESNTKSGKEAQAAHKQFLQSAHDSILAAVGKTTDEVDSLANLSEHDIGTKLQDTLAAELKQKISPISEQFSKIKDKYSAVELAPQDKTSIAESLAKYAQEQGIGKLAGSEEEKLLNKIYESLPKQETLEDLRKLQTSIASEANQKQMWHLAKNVRGIFRDAEDALVEGRLGLEAPELIPQHKGARESYKQIMGVIDDLNDQLHVGRYNGPDSFIHALNEMNPEDMLRRMTPKNRVDFLNTMTKEFPGVANQIKDSYLNQVLKTAGKRATGEYSINPKALFGAIDSLSPELKQFALPAGSQEKINAVKTLMEAVPTKMNNSGTAKTLDSLWAGLPGGAGAMIGMITGHNPVLGGVLGHIGGYIGKEVPDAVKMAMLKFLGGGNPINSEGFAQAVKMASAAIKGENLASKSVKAIFNAAPKAIGSYINEPTSEQREKLKKKLDALYTDNSPLLDVGGQTGHYLPEHGSAISAVAMRGVQYLNSLKPDTTPTGPLDPKSKPSAVATSRYNRALDIAEQPLVTMKAVKDGTLTSEDLTTLKTIYPALYGRLSQKLMDQVMDTHAKGESIPYSTRLSLSLFVGQPLDSTMTPQAILSSQSQMTGQSAQQAPPKMISNSAGDKMSKTAKSYQTPQQARQAEKLARA